MVFKWKLVFKLARTGPDVEACLAIKSLDYVEEQLRREGGGRRATDALQLPSHGQLDHVSSLSKCPCTAPSLLSISPKAWPHQEGPEGSIEGCFTI